MIKNSIKEDISHQLFPNLIFCFGRTRFTNYQYRMHDVCVTTGYDETITPNYEEMFAEK